MKILNKNFRYQSSMENDAPHEHPDSDKGFEDTTKDFLINSCLKSIVDPSMSSILSLSVTEIKIYISFLVGNNLTNS